MKRKVALFMLALVAFTVIDWLVIQNGWQNTMKLGTDLPVYHILAWVASGLIIWWLHRGAFNNIKNKYLRWWWTFFLAGAGGLALFWVLEDMLYAIPWSIKYLGGGYPYPEFIGHWREAMFGSLWLPLARVGAFFEQVWFWGLPAFFYIGLGWSALVYGGYYLWLWAGQKRGQANMGGTGLEPVTSCV
ncbi:hypothetical protein ES703_104189 [subsurface metagenome]